MTASRLDMKTLRWTKLRGSKTAGLANSGGYGATEHFLVRPGGTGNGGVAAALDPSGRGTWQKLPKRPSAPDEFDLSVYSAAGHWVLDGRWARPGGAGQCLDRQHAVSVAWSCR